MGTFQATFGKERTWSSPGLHSRKVFNFYLLASKAFLNGRRRKMFISSYNSNHLRPKEYNRNMSNRSGNFGVHEWSSDEGNELFEQLSHKRSVIPFGMTMQATFSRAVGAYIANIGWAMMPKCKSNMC